MQIFLLSTSYPQSSFMNNVSLNSFLFYSKTMEKISETSSRLEIQSILTEYFKQIIEYKKEELIYVVYLCAALIYPEYKNKQLNLGDSIIYSVLTECTGKKLSELKSEFTKTGDFGIVAMKYRAAQLFISKKSLTVKDVVLKLREIADISGQKARTLKIRKMLEMVSICLPLETKYLFRIFEEKLKIRFGITTVLVSLSKVFDESNDCIKKAYQQRVDIEQLINFILENGIQNIEKDFGICPGIPLKPMLSQPHKNVSCAFKVVENKNFTCENKYDGERIQIHKTNYSLIMFSRNLENSTNKYSDIKLNSIRNKTFVVDGEVVAYDVEKEKILPFQVLSTRKRKNADNSVKVCLFLFDILYFDEVSLIHKSLKERRDILYKEFIEIKNQVYFSEHLDCDNVEDLEDFFKKSIDENYEGIMIKLLNEGSNYIPSQRSNSWIKLKQDYIDSGSDSFDLVVVGVYYGKGKRTGVYGGFLLASYNECDDTFETVCKIGTGFDDQTLERLYVEFNTFICDTPNLVFKEQTKPDLWVQPKVVWEVRSAAVSRSPVYCCSQDDTQRGLSLRFPRFIRERDDKSVRDATTSSEIAFSYSQYNDTSESVVEE